jgi:hypothetical protein
MKPRVGTHEMQPVVEIRSDKVKPGSGAWFHHLAS